jgi:type III restriction enzyme
MHRRETASNWLTSVYPAMEALQSIAYKNTSGEPPRNFKDRVPDLLRIKRYVFNGFARSGGEFCKFDSDAERRFACVLESDAAVLKWIKPAAGVLQLRYRLDGVERNYEPDFVVETKADKFMVEVKADGDIKLSEVQEKAKVGVKWCQAATEHAAQHAGKPWKYLLLRDARVLEIGSTMAGLERLAEVINL